ncbi:MAG: nitroreductase [Dehalococcoidia bacterium]|nr:nitroreductase [Dehalococcoidia bacterium]
MEREPLDVLEAIHSTRSMRYLKPDPIPDEVLWQIVDAAIRGPTGSNRQTWGWIVVRDPAKKKQIADWYRDGWNIANRVDKRDREARMEIAKRNPLGLASYLSVEHLAEHLEEAPAYVIVVQQGAAGRPSLRAGSSIYGAVQNLCLAARAFGIGSTFTTAHAIGPHEDDVKRLLGIPEDAVTMCLIPLGYPSRGKFSEPRRQPVEEVTHWDHWGATRTR